MTDANRVYLRNVSKQDRREFLSLMQKSQRLHDPWITPPLAPATFDRYLARTQRDDHEGLLVCLNETHAIIGVVNLNNIIRGSFLSASLGYYAGAPYAGMGYMREGLEIAIQNAFREIGLHRLEANIQPENILSIRLVKRCGFYKEGMAKNFLYIAGAWRDHERWVIIHERNGMSG
ncbi:MAG: GNAT family N-acetyltransferase [Gammaproteobacteria bacterium]|nr:MAG: GNAT family N-acetyltransferase [Gammaproteobacteria bacterium]